MKSRARLIAILGLAALLAAAVPSSAGPQAADGWNDKGVQLTKDGRFRDAVNAFLKALDEAPSNDTIRRNLALARGNLGVELLQARDLSGAESETRAALEILPEDPVLHLNLAACLDERGYPSKASAAVKRASELGPSVVAVQEKLASVLYREGDVPGAVKAWSAVAEREPENADVGRRLDRARKSLAMEAELSHEFSSHFVIHFDMEKHAVLASRVLQVLEAAHGVVGAELQATARDRLKIVLLNPGQFRECTGTAGWVAGLFDGQIRLPVRSLDVEKPDALLGRARHEYVHAVLAPLGKRAPSWLHEGLAQVHEGRALRAARKRLRERGKPVAFDQLTRSFVRTEDGDRARLLYDTSLSFVAWLRQGERRAGFRAAMQYLYEDEQLIEAFQRGYHVPLTDLYEAFVKEIVAPTRR